MEPIFTLSSITVHGTNFNTETLFRYAAPHDMRVRMSLGSNDGAKVWVNEKEVFSWCGAAHGGRSAQPHQDEFEVDLKEGSNQVLVKVENLGGGWQLYLSVRDPDRNLEFMGR